MEKKIEFEKRLKDVLILVIGLVDDDDVLSHTALYGFLSSAQTSLSLAVSHVGELNDIQLCNE